MTRRRRILIGLAVILFAIPAIPALLVVTGYLKLFHTPSVSMAPTMMEGDRWAAWMVPPASFTRGDIVLFDTHGMGMWAKRVIGLPGDRVEMRGGELVLNGSRISRRFLGPSPAPGHGPGYPTGVPARRLAEQLPGEAGPHEILDIGQTVLDDVPEQVVAPGHVFVIGDNRDDSVDSRMPVSDHGVGQIPVANIVGVPWRYYSWHRFGQAAGH